MAKRMAQKREAVSFTAASGQTPKAVAVGHVTTLERADLLILLGLAVVTFGIYAQVIGHRFITIDDLSYIEENPIVNRGVTLGGLAWAFSTFHQANWHPLTWIVLLRTTHARWSSALVAALFALHPLHVESVAWAAERKDTLSTFFGLLSLIAYTRYAEAPSIRRYAWTAITLALGLMAKPILVTWPFVMLLLDYWPLRRFDLTSRREVATKVWPLVREKLPLFALVAASAVVTCVAQSHGGAVRTFTDAPVALRLSNALVSYAKYVLRAFWPNDLAVFYPFPGTDFPAGQIIGAALLLIGITAFCLFQRKVRPYLIVGWLWFLGTLVPVIGLVQVGGQTMADRYFYIPSIGLFIAIVFGLADIAEKRRVAPWVSAAIANVVVLVTPPNAAIERSLGYALQRSGRLDEAAAHFEKALQLTPDDHMALLYMGVCRFYQGRVPEAIEYAEATIRLQPDVAKAHDLLGMSLAMQNQNEAALDEMRRAAELAPKDAEIRNDLGAALVRQGRIPEAIDQFHESLRLNPNNAPAHANLGSVLLASGKPRESIPEFEAALQLDPKSKAAADGLRQAQAQLSPQR